MLISLDECIFQLVYTYNNIDIVIKHNYNWQSSIPYHVAFSRVFSFVRNAWFSFICIRGFACFHTAPLCSKTCKRDEMAPQLPVSCNLNRGFYTSMLLVRLLCTSARAHASCAIYTITNFFFNLLRFNFHFRFHFHFHFFLKKGNRNFNVKR